MKKKVIYAIVAIVIVLVISYYSLKYKEGVYMSQNKAPVDNKAPPPKKDDPACFLGDSVIYLENGETKQIQDAKLGDKILSFNMRKNIYVYSPIIAVAHEKNKQVADFIDIKTSRKNRVKMTKSHLLPVLQKSAEAFKLITADKVDVGDIIISKDGNDIVESITTIELEGVYTVVTKEEYIVVDNIVASPFFENFHMLGNIYYSLFRALYNINPNIIKSNMYQKFNEFSHAFYLHAYTSLLD
uniref:Hint domain-containing protein n=1 Tax=viral metagenome TaxID=1070528 RepID=A0A6C0B683_9ZZZZ